MFLPMACFCRHEPTASGGSSGTTTPRDGGVHRPEELTPPNEFSTHGGVPTLREVLEEYAQGVPNYGYDPAGPRNPWAFYPLSFDVEQDPDYLEDQALFDSLSAGLRTQFQGAAAELVGAWKKEQERAEAQRKRDEAEYAVFIEEHLRRRYGGSED